MTRAVSIAVLAVALGAPAIVSAERTDIRQAYGREFAFLKAEKSSLGQRIAAAKQEAEEKRADARAQIDGLQGSIMSATVEAERLAELMYETERSVEGVAEGADALQRTFEQLSATLEKYDEPVPEASAPAAPSARAEGDAGDSTVDLGRLDAGLGAALSLLVKVNALRTAEGSYFDASGNKVEGPVLHVGSVASYGLAEGSRGVLAPAGADRMKLWVEPGSDATAEALAAGQRPSVLQIFLYEALDKDMEKRPEKTAISVIESGGIIAWVIVALGGLAAFMIALRTLLLLRSRANTGRLVAQLEPLLDRQQLDAAIQMCRNSRSAAGRVLRTTLQNLEREREHLEDIISEAILHETPTLDRFGSTILVMAAVAPLLGLLGTVTGMISTFDVITEFGTGNPKLLSGGISEALVTTELGLIVAIPSLLLGNLLTGWADRIKDDIDKAALRVTNVATGIRVARFAAPSAPPAPRPPRSEAARA